MPIGIIASLLICTVLYIAVAAVLTGMVPYDQIDIDAPVSDAFQQAGLPWAAVPDRARRASPGITSVLLVMMLSQPRVFLAMARDGLLPPSFFGAVHPQFRTPWKSTILTGVFVAVAGGLPAAADPGRADEHRHAVRLRHRLRGGADHAPDAPRRRAARSAPRSCRFVPILGHPDLPAADVLAAGRELVAAVRLAGASASSIYFGYGRHHSVMAHPDATTAEVAAVGASGAGTLRSPNDPGGR